MALGACSPADLGATTIVDTGRPPDAADFCDAVLDDIESTFVHDGMTDVEVEDTMRRSARHYERAAATAPSDIRGDVLQVALNYQLLADAMAAGEPAFQALLTPPSGVDFSATDAVSAHLAEHCR